MQKCLRYLLEKKKDSCIKVPHYIGQTKATRTPRSQSYGSLWKCFGMFWGFYNFSYLVLGFSALFSMPLQLQNLSLIFRGWKVGFQLLAVRQIFIKNNWTLSCTKKLQILRDLVGLLFRWQPQTLPLIFWLLKHTIVNISWSAFNSWHWCSPKIQLHVLCIGKKAKQLCYIRNHMCYIRNHKLLNFFF